MVFLIALAGGALVGLVVGRWWTLVAPAAFAVWVYFASEVEVPSWYLALVYGLSGAAGVVVGVLARRRLRGY